VPAGAARARDALQARQHACTTRAGRLPAELPTGRGVRGGTPRSCSVGRRRGGEDASMGRARGLHVERAARGRRSAGRGDEAAGLDRRVPTARLRPCRGRLRNSSCVRRSRRPTGSHERMCRRSGLRRGPERWAGCRLMRDMRGRTGAGLDRCRLRVPQHRMKSRRRGARGMSEAAQIANRAARHCRVVTVVKADESSCPIDALAADGAREAVCVQKGAAKLDHLHAGRASSCCIPRCSPAVCAAHSILLRRGRGAGRRAAGRLGLRRCV
jgi:hypothetical protein